MKKLAAVSLLMVLSVVFVNFKAFAGADPPVIQVLDGSLDQIHVSSFITVQDNKFFDASYYGKVVKPYPVKNIVSFGINELSTYFIKSNFTAKVKIRIEYVNADSTTVTVDDSLTINYFKDSIYTNNSSYVFAAGYKVKVTILDTSSNASWNVWKVLQVSNQLQAWPVYNFNCAVDTIKQVSPLVSLPEDTELDELQVGWSDKLNANEYDLEWTYVDSSAFYSGRYGDTSSPSPALIFDNNASRVTVTAATYAIPLIYDGKGILFFRVRPVQTLAGNGRKEGKWSSDFLPTGLGRFVYNGHETALNWQSSTSFAEDGKRKTVVQYFDGSLRSRQTVTKDNTTNTTIVAESYYDYQGRAVIQVLPSPTLSTIIKYSHNFNLGMNGNAYDKEHFDDMDDPEDFCNLSAQPMKTDSGASRYYSPDNPDASRIIKFVPDAQGYPFTEVEYTQDNTGRIKRQGGVGAINKLGGHETKYYYATPDQKELDALFGTEAGDYSHYFKTMVRDPNGQASVTYADMHGRTVATALAGKPLSSQLDTLESYNVKYITETLASPSSVVIKDLVMQHKKSLLVEKAGTHVFTYNLSPQSLQIESCDSVNVCYDCLYDLHITITDDCNNTKLPGGHPINIVLHNFSIGGIDDSCNAAGFEYSFSQFLQEGNYEITKSLSVSRYGIEYYRDSVFALHNTCKTLDSFMREQRELLAQVMECKPTCQSCKDSVGTWPDYLERFIDRAGISADTTGYTNIAYNAWLKALEDCSELCNTSSEANDIRKAMLLDMTAPSGQYANIDSTHDVFSIFYNNISEDHDPGTAVFRKPANYFNEAGEPDMVFDEEAGILVSPGQLSPDAFSKKFKLSWAEALLPYHPEYCKLMAYEQLQLSHEWDKRFGATETYQEALERGYLNPTNMSGSPFDGPSGTKDYDPLATVYDSTANNYKWNLEQRLNEYKYTDYYSVSLWALATVTVICRDSSSASPCFDNYRLTDSAFSATFCTGDLDMMWRVFRQMYLDVKREIVNNRIQSICDDVTPAMLVEAHHQPHFSHANELLHLNDMNPPVDEYDAAGQASSVLYQQFDANCRAYASYWWQQLKSCYSIEDSADIISRLVEVCKEGSDVRHPLGSSSVAPTSNATLRSFEQVLEQYNQSHGYTGVTCNPYAITAPKPYDQQVAYDKKPIWTKPDECECTRIAELRGEYLKQTSTYSSFSDYLFREYKTSITDSVLSILLNMCNDTAATCRTLVAPVLLPQAMQCSTGDVCVDCKGFEKVSLQFEYLYPEIRPVAYPDPEDSVQLSWNKLYEDFMNYKLGFAKSAREYLAFADTCKAFNPGAANSCDSLQSIISAFKLYGGLPHPDAGGCDTTHWKVNYNGGEKTPDPGYSVTYDAPVPLSGIFVGGIASHPSTGWPLTGSIKQVKFDYGDSLIMGTGNYIYRVRLKAPDATLTSGSLLAKLGLTFNSVTGNTEVHATIYHDTLNLIAASDTIDIPLSSTINFDTWHDVSLRFSDDSLQVYFDAQRLGSRRISFATSRVLNFYTGIYSTDPQMDYVKIFDNAETLFYEGFDGCNKTALTGERFTQQQCDTAFRNYFNAVKGTSYTTSQIDSIYVSACGVAPDVCGGQDCFAGGTFKNAFKISTPDLILGNSGSYIAATPDGGSIVGGSVSMIVGEELILSQYFVSKISKRGDITWLKVYPWQTSYPVVKKILLANDGGYFVLTNDYMMIKLNARGGFEASKTFNFDHPPVDALMLDNGDVAVLNSYQSDSSGFSISCFSPALEQKWVNKCIFDPLGPVQFNPAAFLLDGDSLVIAGDKNYGQQGWLVKVHKNGIPALSSTLNIAPKFFSKDRLQFTGIVQKGTHYVVNASYTDAEFATHPLIIETTSDLNLVSSKVVSKAGEDLSDQKLYSLQNGSVAATYASYGYNMEYLVKMDAGAISWAKQFNAPFYMPINGLAQSANEDILTAGDHTTEFGNTTLRLMKFKPDGTASCDTTTALLSLADLALTTADSLFILTEDGYEMYDNEYYPTPSNYVKQELCGTCGRDALTGPTLCGRAAPIITLQTDTIDNCFDSSFFIVSKATELYKIYADSVKDHFDSAYRAKCLQAYKYESFTVRHEVSEFHYTLYYYDQAGNLVKTVSPQGVHANYDSLWLDSVRLARLAGEVKVPAHTLVTQYRYNTLNQVTAQHSPDAGKSRFWYDRLGRLVLSQNAKQYADSSEAGSYYSYTKYDSIGRVTEVGQILDSVTGETMTDALARNQGDLTDWFAALATKREQVTETIYDVAYDGFTGIGSQYVVSQRNLRNRVSISRYSDGWNTAKFNHATYYTYDIHGNVDTLLQDYGISGYVPNIMNKNGYQNRFKRLVYQYDLVSGKVNHVAYNPHQPDEFYHRYTYDADNKLLLVETSSDSAHWEADAQYEYYKHGPLARMVIGEQLVQGIDYAYTIQGWLKGVNASNLRPAYDMGEDGSVGGTNQFVARDELGFSLNYHNGDYVPINNTVNPFPGHSGYMFYTEHRQLYNGNISSMVVNIGKLPGAYLYTYTYDQLNRLKGMKAYTGLDTANSWSGLTSTLSYTERYRYDANGNILNLDRYTDNTASGPMDSLSYSYYSGTNRLRRVRDFGANYYMSNRPDVADQSTADNYTYDAIGNLITDAQEGITNIKWSVYGKILEIDKTATTDNPVTKIAYSYDATGNRISKTVWKNGTDTVFYTWYVRDAQGNVMKTYSTSGTDTNYTNLNLKYSEQAIYGSSRLGMISQVGDAEAAWSAQTYINTYRGYKQYELSNHLGNVLVTLSDEKDGVQSGVDTNLVAYYNAVVMGARDYYPFGMVMPERKYGGAGYRYGFNGKEEDDEVKGDGNQQDYGMRIYDPRLGRFLSVDPLTKEYPWFTPYQFAGNKPIAKLDLDGLEEYDYTFYLKSRKGGMCIIAPPVSTQVLVNAKAPLHYNFKFNLDGKLYSANSIMTLNGRDDQFTGAGSFTGVQELNRQDLVNILGYSSFIINRLHYGNVEGAMLSESNAGPQKRPSALLDFKNRLYELFGFNRQDLITIDGVTYNANEAGNYLWSFVLHYNGSLLDAESIAEVGSLIQGRHDEPHEKKAIQAGAKKGASFSLSKEEQTYARDVYQRMLEDYEYFYEDPANEDKLWRTSGELGGLKTIREREGKQPLLPTAPYERKR